MRAKRISILHPDDMSGDKDIDLEHTGHVYANKEKVKVKESDVPDWFKPGVVVVGTDHRGRTIDGFVVDWKMVGSSRGKKRRIILDTDFPP